MFGSFRRKPLFLAKDGGYGGGKKSSHISSRTKKRIVGRLCEARGFHDWGVGSQRENLFWGLGGNFTKRGKKKRRPVEKDRGNFSKKSEDQKNVIKEKKG